jgi:hypothetical protein
MLHYTIRALKLWIDLPQLLGNALGDLDLEHQSLVVQVGDIGVLELSKVQVS